MDKSGIYLRLSRSELFTHCAILSFLLFLWCVFVVCLCVYMHEVKPEVYVKGTHAALSACERDPGCITYLPVKGICVIFKESAFDSMYDLLYFG